MPDKTSEQLAAEKEAADKAAASKGKKQKHFKVVEKTTYQGRVLLPEGKLVVSITPDKDGKCLFDDNRCWKECAAPKKDEKDNK
jgi:hypothetical protein